MWFVASPLLSSMSACKDHGGHHAPPGPGTPLLSAWEPQVLRTPLTTDQSGPLWGFQPHKCCKQLLQSGGPGLGPDGVPGSPVWTLEWVGRALADSSSPAPRPPLMGQSAGWKLGFCLHHPPSPGDGNHVGPWDPLSPSRPSGQAGPGGISAITSLSRPPARTAECTPLRGEWEKPRPPSSAPPGLHARLSGVQAQTCDQASQPSHLRPGGSEEPGWWPGAGGRCREGSATLLPGSCSDRKDEAMLSRASSGL